MCVSPITIYCRNAGHFHSRSGSHTVPCGHCVECVKSKQLEWCVRMVEQIKDTPDALFVTLTYRPEMVPVCVDVDSGEVNLTVCKADVQRWVKRAKIGLSRRGRDFSRRPLHYFITSEYGMHPKRPNMYRPHYHAIFFNVTLDEFLPALQDWRARFGYVNYSVPRNRYASMRYCSKYCVKGDFENPLIAQRKVLPTFHLVSHGLGAGYIKRMRSWHLNPTSHQHLDSSISDRKVNLYYSKKYVEFVADNLYYRDIHLYDKFGDKAFKVKLPRYYKDRILGIMVFCYSSNPKTNKKVVSKSALANQVANFLARRRIELRDRARDEFIRQGLASSFGEADILLLESERISFQERNKKAFEALTKFYSKSKF